MTRQPLGAGLVALALLVSACTTSTPAPSASPSGPAKPAASASAAAASPAPSGSAKPAATPTAPPMIVTGTLALSPTHGPIGSTVTAKAAGLKVATKYDVVWTTVVGAWKLTPDKSGYLGREYTAKQIAIGSITTDAAGAATTSFVVPEGYGFQHDVQIVDSDKVIRNQQGFDVDMELTVTPKSGPPGTPIKISARGIGWRQLQNSWMLSYDNLFTGLLSAVQTQGTADAVIPAAGRPGTHIITVWHGDFTVPYLNGQQSPEPDRPQWRIPFVVTEGEAVLPSPADQQSLPVDAGKPVDKGIWTEPASGKVGTQAALKGKGLAANADVELNWWTMVGNRVVANTMDEKISVLSKVKTDASGSFSLPFTVPDDLGGDHKIAAKIGNDVVGTTAYNILASAFPMTKTRGPSGTEVMIKLKGVGWTETANIFNVTYDNGYVGYACGFNSGGSVDVPWVFSGDKGWHFVDFYPGIYKGAETRPQNFRIPQLSFAKDHPGEKLPAFHFAFFIE